MSNVRGGGERSPSNLTIPNALTLLRALGIPVFLWALFADNQDFLAIAILVLAGATDYLDGKLARALNQYSRLGELLDPLVDRLYIAAVLIGLTIREVIPLWLLTLLILRDLILALPCRAYIGLGRGRYRSHFSGKRQPSTFCTPFRFCCWQSKMADGRALPGSLPPPLPAGVFSFIY